MPVSLVPEVPMPILAAAVGAAICLMLVANATLQQALDPITALVIVHTVGLALILPLAALVRLPGSRTGPIPWPLFTGGLVGVVLLWINNRTVPVLGVGVAVGLGVLGQLIASAVVDHFGLFGLEQRRFRFTKALGLAVAGVGVLLMVGV